jgi:hypothetical protein
MKAEIKTWTYQEGTIITATLEVRPLGCPKGRSMLDTNCAGCDEFDGLTFIKGPLQSMLVTVKCALNIQTNQEVSDDTL